MLAPFRNQRTLIRLREQFYETNEQETAIRTVNILQTRGQLPHAVDATASLVSALRAEKAGFEPHLLQFTYGAALVRFVNGLLDPYQTASVALPLVKLAKDIELPAAFVEIRHMVTHEEIPSLSLCHKLAKEALEWLRKYYWDELLEKENRLDAAILPSYDHDQFVDQTHVSKMLKAYRHLTKHPLENTDNGVLSSTVKKLTRYASSSRYSCILTTLLFFDNHLIYSEEKCLTNPTRENRFEELLSLYQPLLDELSRSSGGGFLISLLFGIIYHNSQLASQRFKHHEKMQANSWCRWLGVQIKKITFPVSTCHQKFSSEEEMNAGVSAYLSLLDTEDVIYKTIEPFFLAQKSKDSEPEKRYGLPPTLDEILGGLVQSRPKKRKIDHNDSKIIVDTRLRDTKLPLSEPSDAEQNLVPTVKELALLSRVFPRQSSWKPTPFGSR